MESNASAQSVNAERKYLILVYHDEAKLAALSQEQLDALVVECGEWVDDLHKSGRHVASAALQSPRTATTVSRRNGKIWTTDGPYAETKEQLGGFTLITASDLNEAIQIASRLPVVKMGSVEVRPLLDPDDNPSDPIDRKVAIAFRRNPKPITRL